MNKRMNRAARYSAQQWAQMIAEQQSSGETVEAYCALQGPWLLDI